MMSSREVAEKDKRMTPRLAMQTPCTGCFACRSICPADAIAAERDGYGFLIPKVDDGKCLSCGRCEAACSANDFKGEVTSGVRAFAARSLDENIRMQSSSGGVFSELASGVLRDNGCVFGCVLEENTLKAVHKKAESLEEIAPMRGSKYVQSDVRDTFRECKQELTKGRRVLYSGTPCQIAGLKRYLGKEYESLLTVDVICHGVPSPAVFDKYKSDVVRKVKSPLVALSFRDKVVSWVMYSMRLSFARTGENRTETLLENPYLRSFLSNLSLRESCYKCPAKGGKSGADITLADFWGIDKVLPEWDDHKGVSAVLVRSSRGELALDNIRGRIMCAPVALEQVLAAQPSYYNSTTRPPKRDVYMKGLASHSFDRWVVACTRGSGFRRIARGFYYRIRGLFGLG